MPEKQDEAQATYAPILKKEDGRIDWSMGASEIVNRVRGLRAVAGMLWIAAGTAVSHLESATG